MTIFVDELFDAVPRTVQARQYGTRWCHMTCNGDLEELHQFAVRLGLRREWFQNHPAHPHYDLTASKRTLAMRLGAQEITVAERLQMARAKSDGQQQTLPQQAESTAFACMALSISQPWTWALAAGVKDIENRTWQRPYRGLVLLHAGKRGEEPFFDGEAFNALAWQRALQLRGYTGEFPRTGADYPRGGIVGVATLRDIVTRSQSPWFCGPYGFLLKDARPLPFIPCRGERYFFAVPNEVMAQVQQVL